MLRQSRQEQRLRAIRCAEFRLRQRLEYIDWRFDRLEPEVAEFLSKASLPEAPTPAIVEVIKDEEDPGPSDPGSTAS